MDPDALRNRWRHAADWLDASPAEVAGLAALVVGALAVVAVLWVTGRPGPAPGVTTAPPGGPTAAAVPVGGAPTTAGEVTVHVAGAVARPGLVRLSAGARVADAVDAAGGALLDADLDALNLARAVVDGERLDVARIGEVATGTTPTHGGPDGGGPRARGVLDLNRATAEQLQVLPGVGPVLARRIVAWREEHGPFTRTGQLRDVPGIGEKTFQRLAERVVV